MVAGVDYIKIELEKIQDGDLFSDFEEGVRCGICECTGKRFDVLMVKEKYMIETQKISGLGMLQLLPHADKKLDEQVSLEKIISTAANADTGSVLEIDLKHLDRAQKVSSTLPFSPENKGILKTEYSEFMKNTKVKH